MTDANDIARKDGPAALRNIIDRAKRKLTEKPKAVRPKSQTDDGDLEEMNAKYAVVLVSGKTRIVSPLLIRVLNRFHNSGR